MMAGLLVLGTDTGCGKTVVSSLLLAELRRRGLRVAPFKPVETGCNPDPLDALALRAAAGSDDPLDLVCPYRFRLPAAPEAAAAEEAEAIDPGRLVAAFEKLASGGRFVLAESAGGAGTPYAADLLALDLARVLDLPVLVVARAVLGTIGQTLVALRALERAGGTCLGVVLCRVDGRQPGPEDPTNAPLIAAHASGIPVLGTLPHLAQSPPSPRSAGEFLSWADLHAPVLADNVDVDLILR